MVVAQEVAGSTPAYLPMKLNRRYVARKLIDWCLDYYGIRAKIRLRLTTADRLNAFGRCDALEKEYVVRVAKDQKLKDFLATVAHEMVHVKQWETGEWEGDGEEEAEDIQYLLVEMFLQDWFIGRCSSTD